jgi:acyl-[acyl carrier protein]--UDP-N-acetylglucosamine O-acyltransferase
MKTLYLWVSDKGWTPFQYNELSELSSEFEARNIKLGDECKLGNWCKLGNECKLGNWCKLGNGCELGDECKLGDWCELGNGCKLGYRCELGNWCKLGNGCDVPKSLFISASHHTVSYWGEDVIQIGCKRYTISEWQKHFRKIGEAKGYSPEQIEEYKGYINLIATMHKTWKVEKVKDK